MRRRRTGPAFDYDSDLGRWWQTRAADRAHGNAYLTVANYIRASFRQSPGLIVDYACGAGNLLSRLGRRFPRSKFVGLDGSTLLLDEARRRLARMGRERCSRILLIHTYLPGCDLPVRNADLVVFSFPNMVPCAGLGDPGLCGHLLGLDDLATAHRLADASEPDRGREDAEAIRHALLQGRRVSLDLRRLLRRGGYCVRVEYGKAHRHELSLLDLKRISFEEGSLAEWAAGKPHDPWFRVVASTYHRSSVVQDVYQQTGDDDDRVGGYLITVLRAV